MKLTKDQVQELGKRWLRLTKRSLKMKTDPGISKESQSFADGMAYAYSCCAKDLLLQSLAAGKEEVEE